MTNDTRPLPDRIAALANRFQAMAIGARKRPNASLQNAINYEADAATLLEAATLLSGVRTPPPFRQTWPYALVMADNAATPGGHNVRQLDGTVVFTTPVDHSVARQTCDALNRNWEQRDSRRAESIAAQS